MHPFPVFLNYELSISLADELAYYAPAVQVNMISCSDRKAHSSLQDHSDTTTVWLTMAREGKMTVSRNQDCLEYSKQDQESIEL